MHAIQSLVVSIIFSVALCTSNLDCILGELYSFRKLSGIPDSPLKDSSSNPSLIEKGKDSPGKVPKTTGLGNEGIINSQDEMLNRIEIILRRSLKMNKNLSRGEKALSSELCVPFGVEAQVDVLFATLFCEKLIANDFERSRFILEYRIIANNEFGEIFGSAFNKIYMELKALTLTMNSALFSHQTKKFETELKRSIKQIYSQFSSTFSEIFDAQRDGKFLKLQKELNLDKQLLVLLQNKQKNSPTSKIHILQMLFNLNFKEDKIDKFKLTLADFSHSLEKGVDSDQFIRALDKILVTVDRSKPVHKTIIENAFLVKCFKALSTKNSANPVTTCNKLNRTVFTFVPNQQILFQHLSENKDFFEYLRSVVDKHIHRFTTSNVFENESLSFSLKTEVQGLLTQFRNLLSAAKLSDHFYNSLIPLFWDLKYFLKAFPDQISDFFEFDKAFEKYNEAIKGQLHSSIEVKRLVKVMEEEALNFFNIPREQKITSDFRDAMQLACNVWGPVELALLCQKSGDVLEVRGDFSLKMKPSEFEFLVKKFSQDMAVYNPHLNNQFMLINKGYEILSDAIDELASDFQTLLGLFSEKDNPKAVKRLYNSYLRSKIGSVVTDDIDFTKDLIPEIFEHFAGRHPKTEKSLKKVQDLPSNSRIKSSIFNHSTNPLKNSLLKIMLNFYSLPKALQNSLNKCQLHDKFTKEQADICEHRNGQACNRVNPFLLTPSCPGGFVSDLPDRCIASCPTNFRSLKNGLCGKPSISMIDITKKQSNVQCEKGFIRRGVLCIPQCPSGWQDVGSSCEKPIVRFSKTQIVLLIK